VTRTAAVVGVGLIGGSMAAALRRRGFLVRGLDVAPGRAETARRLGLVDETPDSLEECVRGAEVIVLAAPVDATIALLPAVDGVADETSLVLDVCSVKGPVVDAMSRLPGVARMVGGHPVAGTERSGPETADADLFAGRAFVFCPAPATAPDVLERACALARSIGAEPVVLTAGRHDATLARISHLPQLASTALALCLQPGDAAIAGSGLRDMTRLALSDPALWRAIVLSNGSNVTPELRDLSRRLEQLACLIEAGDAAAVERALREAGIRARELRREAPA